MRDVPADVSIVGGGPSGCAAATLLARCGHSVTLFTKPAADTFPLGESIPPSTRKLFDLLGFSQSIDAADFLRSTGNTVWWGSDTPRIERFADGERGWQVTSARLESALREAAMASGVLLQHERVTPDAPRLSQSAFVLDCTGRTGLLARARRLRVSDATLTTVALVGAWTAERFDLPDPTHTLIESYEGGWAWSVPSRHLAAPGRPAVEHRFVAVMVDPRTSDLETGGEARQIYLAEIRKAPAIHRLLRPATLIEGPRGWDASMYHARRYVDGNVLLVGDAASFIDPVSSAGVKKALASGWLAAVATHTSLVRPEMQQVALDFYSAREQEVYESFRSMTEAYWRDAASGHSHPFWSDRSAVEKGPESSVGRDALVAAFDKVRTAPQLSVTSNPVVTIAERPAVSGMEIVTEQRLIRPDVPSGLRYMHDVDLLALVGMAPRFGSVPALFEAYNARLAPVALPDFLAALAGAIAEHWLLWCDTT